MPETGLIVAESARSGETDPANPPVAAGLDEQAVANDRVGIRDSFARSFQAPGDIRLFFAPTVVVVGDWIQSPGMPGVAA